MADDGLIHAYLRELRFRIQRDDVALSSELWFRQDAEVAIEAAVDADNGSRRGSGDALGVRHGRID